MTLPDRATVQAVGRPQFAALLERQGRPVTVVRVGEPAVQERAIVIPVASQVRQGERPAAPELASLPWKVFFAHTVQSVSRVGFTLDVPPALGQPGLRLVPTTPSVDLADQGVALLVICTPLIERTRVSVLIFTLAGTGTVIDPATLNRIPAPGTVLEVPVRLVASDDPRIREAVGADQAEVVLVGRWGTLDAPQSRPPRIRWGSRSPLALDGQSGTLTVKLAFPDADLAQEQQFGARFLAVWQAGEP